jgi:hypothetical protein
MLNRKVEIMLDEGAGGSPNPAVSSEPNGSIEGADQLSKLLKAEIAEALKPVLAEVRGVQGRQDKDRTEFRGFLDAYEANKKKGMSNVEAELAASSSLQEQEKQVKRDTLIDQLAQKFLGASLNGNETIAHAELVKNYNLDANDPDVIANVLSQTDPKDAKIAALELVAKRQTSPTPNASAASTIVSAPAKPASVDQLTEQYRKDMLAARGKPGLLKSIKENAFKNGVPVDQVIFS